MSGDAEGSDIRTAIHEAGHAVAAWALGRHFDTISIVADEGTGGRVSSRIAGLAPEDAAVIALAGPAAEGLEYMAPDGGESFPGWRNDIDAAFLALGADEETDVDGCEAFVATAYTRAARIVIANWPLVVALAMALLDERELTASRAIDVAQASGARLTYADEAECMKPTSK